MKIQSIYLVTLATTIVGTNAFFRNPCKKKRKDILCRLYNWRCPRDCSTNGILIESLRSIADPRNQTKPDLKYDLDNDGRVTLIDFVMLLNKTLETHTPESLVPGGNLTQYVFDHYNSSQRQNDRALMMTTKAKTTNGTMKVSRSCSGSGEYNGYKRGKSPTNRKWRPTQDFVYNPALSPRWYDYFLYVATMDLAGLTSTSTAITYLLSVNPLIRIGAVIILEAMRQYIENKYIGTEEGIKGFRHYLLNTGTKLSIDYKKAVREDQSIANTYNLELREAKDAARALRGEADTSFQFYNSKNRNVTSSTVNWKGALGRHTMWSEGTVTYDGSVCGLQINLTVVIKDLYDFNRDDNFIGEAAKQASNVFGRFTEYGWAMPFTTETTTNENVKTTLQCCKDSDCGDETAFDCTCNVCETQCPTTQLSGGQGFSVFAVDLKKTKGTFATSYDMYTIPDALDIFYEGKNVYSTGGLVSGAKTVQVTYGSNSTTNTTTVFVQINAPNNGTAWEVFVGCPP